MAVKKADQTPQEVQLLHPYLKAFLIDLTAFFVLFSASGAVIWPVVNMTVIEPQQRLERRLDKLEAAHEQTKTQLANIDKNLAVLAEGVGAIRLYIQKEGR